MPIGEKNQISFYCTRTMINAWSFFNVILKGKETNVMIRIPFVAQRFKVQTFFWILLFIHKWNGWKICLNVICKN